MRRIAQYILIALVAFVVTAGMSSRGRDVAAGRCCSVPGARAAR